MLSFILTVKRFSEALVKAFKTPMFLSLFTTLFLIILSGTLFYTNKEGWGVVDAIYFCVVSLIPTGVNTNLTPVTNLGKIFTMLYLVVGTGVMFITLLTLGKTMINTKALEERKTEGKKKLNEYRKKK
ncbi:Ion channel [Psychrobacillus psychrotolerans]|uniref:Ion channel n=1 Tax=Psychrobacillus psychrotolerans TaxID=126156 RepID=A0A1I5ZGN9_9BACI|nr:potassium channel family protein [Psychrobacillus psychrotolerans]SFQ55644.1 Ion channel [Psychrobacillus psychrotolerans]